MGFSFGFGSSKNKSSYTGTDTYDKTTAPTNPDWVNFGGESLWNGAQKLGGQDPQTFVAGPNQLQYTGAANAQNMTGDPWNYDNAVGWTNDVALARAPTTQGVTAAGYIDSYMNPYLSQVVDATKADLDAQAGQTRAQQQLDLAKSKALGGSGSALAIGQTEGQLARAMGTTLGNLRYQGFDTAAQNAQQDAARQQGANDLNAQLALQAGNQKLAAARQVGDLSAQQTGVQNQVAQTQSAIGDQMRQIQQQQAQAPLDLQSWLASQFSGLPLNLYHGETENGTETQSGSSKGKSNSFSFGFGGGK